MRALITGIGGFVGRHLMAHLRTCGDEVIGLARRQDAQDLPRDVVVQFGNLADRGDVEAAIRHSRPDVVYHLAAQSSTGDSLSDPWGTLSNNLRAQMNLFEALLAADLKPRVLVVGSSDEYGRVRPEDVPTNEMVPLRPVSPYATSKVGQDAMAYQYFAQHDMPTVRVRPFSHTGPGQDARFVVPSFAKQVAEVEAGQRDPEIHVGNLDVWRDFSDVRDIVRAYRLAALEGEPGEVYNLGRGEPVLIRQVLDDLIELADCQPSVVLDPTLFRQTDVPRQIADVTKFRSLTGWEPQIPWSATLRDTLDYWRARIAAARPAATQA